MDAGIGQLDLLVYEDLRGNQSPACCRAPYMNIIRRVRYVDAWQVDTTYVDVLSLCWMPDAGVQTPALIAGSGAPFLRQNAPGYN